MKCERKNREAGYALGDLVEALYDGVSTLPLSDPAKVSLVALMLGDVMRLEGRTIYFQTPPRRKIQLDAA